MCIRDRSCCDRLACRVQRALRKPLRCAKSEDGGGGTHHGRPGERIQDRAVRVDGRLQLGLPLGRLGPVDLNGHLISPQNWTRRSTKRHSCMDVVVCAAQPDPTTGSVWVYVRSWQVPQRLTPATIPPGSTVTCPCPASTSEHLRPPAATPTFLKWPASWCSSVDM